MMPWWIPCALRENPHSSTYLTVVDYECRGLFQLEYWFMGPKPLGFRAFLIHLSRILSSFFTLLSHFEVSNPSLQHPQLAKLMSSVHATWALISLREELWKSPLIILFSSIPPRDLILRMTTSHLLKLLRDSWLVKLSTVLAMTNMSNPSIKPASSS